MRLSDFFFRGGQLWHRLPSFRPWLICFNFCESFWYMCILRAESPLIFLKKYFSKTLYQSIAVGCQLLIDYKQHTMEILSNSCKWSCTTVKNRFDQLKTGLTHAFPWMSSKSKNLKAICGVSFLLPIFLGDSAARVVHVLTLLWFVLLSQRGLSGREESSPETSFSSTLFLWTTHSLW